VFARDADYAEFLSHCDYHCLRYDNRFTLSLLGFRDARTQRNSLLAPALVTIGSLATIYHHRLK
jgi:hypothetical protein